MTLRIEQTSDGQTTTLRLIGQFQSEHLEAVKEQMQGSGPRTALDLDEVTLVDVHVVRFLGRCEQEGTELLHCPLYIREWISRERRRIRTGPKVIGEKDWIFFLTRQKTFPVPAAESLHSRYCLKGALKRKQRTLAFGPE